MKTYSNFSYHVPWHRPINDSHCSSIITFIGQPRLLEHPQEVLVRDPVAAVLEVPEPLPALRDLPRELADQQPAAADRRDRELLQQRRSGHADRRAADQRRDRRRLIADARRDPAGARRAAPADFRSAATGLCVADALRRCFSRRALAPRAERRQRRRSRAARRPAGHALGIGEPRAPEPLHARAALPRRRARRRPADASSARSSAASRSTREGRSRPLGAAARRRATRAASSWCSCSTRAAPRSTSPTSAAARRSRFAADGRAPRDRALARRERRRDRPPRRRSSGRRSSTPSPAISATSVEFLLDHGADVNARRPVRRHAADAGLRQGLRRARRRCCCGAAPTPTLRRTRRADRRATAPHPADACRVPARCDAA